MTALKRRSGPSVATRTASTPSRDASHSSLYARQNGYAAPTAEDRHEAAVLAAAAALGYRLGTRCLRCGHWVVVPKSVAAHMGPVCRRKVAGR